MTTSRPTRNAAVRTARAGHGRDRTTVRAASLACALSAATLMSCADSNVPFFTAPTSVPNTAAGIQDAVTGLFSATRGDQGLIVLVMAGYARQYADFDGDPRFVLYFLGVLPTPSSFPTAWDAEYSDVALAQTILARLPQVRPAYSAADAAAISGVVQTLEALNYMYVAEFHDSLGMAILQSTTAATPPPMYCLKDSWAYIVALLDSANASLTLAVTLAGPNPLPVRLPTGFGAVSSIAAPSSTSGAFAAFNRALAGKAGLELAYAIARSSAGTAPTPTTAGSPDAAALANADAALTSSALYNPAALSPTPTGQFAHDQFSVLHDFSATSGDQANPLNAIIGSGAVLNDFVADVDTTNDLRWKAKFAPNPNAVGLPPYNLVASPFIYTMYASPDAPIPIVRNEELTLVRAQIQLGLGNFALAAQLINDVRQQVGGLPAAVIANNYIATRDALLKEQNISTAVEGSYDRTIALRLYNLEAALDTTWDHTQFAPDQHTTVSPIPDAEVAGRGGRITLTCS